MCKHRQILQWQFIIVWTARAPVQWSRPCKTRVYVLLLRRRMNLFHGTFLYFSLTSTITLPIFTAPSRFAIGVIKTLQEVPRGVGSGGVNEVVLARSWCVRFLNGWEHLTESYIGLLLQHILRTTVIHLLPYRRGICTTWFQYKKRLEHAAVHLHMSRHQRTTIVGVVGPWSMSRGVQQPGLLSGLLSMTVATWILSLLGLSSGVSTSPSSRSWFLFANNNHHINGILPSREAYDGFSAQFWVLLRP